MKNKRSWLSVLLALVLVLCFSINVAAAAIDHDVLEDANKYFISADIADGTVSTDKLYIGTVDNYLGAGAAVFENGEAISPHDILIMNNKVGIVLAVGTRNPWGYPSGSILDAGRVLGAASGTDLKGNVTFGRDTVWSVEFLMNGWDSWSPNNSGKVEYSLVNYDFEAKEEAAGGIPAVRVARVYDQKGGVEFDVVTYYGIAPDQEYAFMFDTVQNTDGQASAELSNRFSITNKGDDGGAMADLGLLTGINTYGKSAKNTFATTLILPGKNTGYVNGESVGDRPWSRNGGSVGYKELRANYAYAADEYRIYDGYLFIDDQADTKAVVDFLNVYHGATTQTVSGSVKDAAGSGTVSEPVVIVQKGGKLYGWFIGNADGSYSFDLPQGDYTLYVETAGYGKGKPVDVKVADKALSGTNLNAGEALGAYTFNITDQNGDPIWAKVEIEGLYPAVRFTGDSVFYPEDKDSKGTVTVMVPPGEFTAKVFGEGYYFYSEPNVDTYETGVALKNPYTDIDKHWGKQYILILTHHGILNGFSDKTYRPDKAVTRAQFSKMVAELFTLETQNDTTSLPFKDVSSKAWYYDYVKVLFDLGLVNGVSEDLFRPDDPIKRQDMSVLLYRTIMYMGDAEEPEADSWDTFAAYFKDAGKVGLYAREACAFMYENEMMKGRNNKMFAPLANTTRAEAATIFQRFFGLDVATDTEADVEIEMVYETPEGWISTDPHHHANKNDAFALPEDVIKSTLVSGLDVAFISDHDFTTNNYEAYQFAGTYNLAGFVPSEEISCSWAHFNVIPQTSDSYDFFLDENEENNVMNQFEDFQDFVDQTHDHDATITANHPYYSYGLFYTAEGAGVPGGYSDDFDNIEINACCDDNENIATINMATELWTAFMNGEALDREEYANNVVQKPHYLVGASDTHDVLYPGIANNKGSSSVYHTGKARTYVYLGDSVDEKTLKDVGLATGQAIANGECYASLGPILIPEDGIMFGNNVHPPAVQDGSVSFDIDVKSLNGIAQILILSGDGEGTYDYNGETINGVADVINLSDTPNEYTVTVSDTIGEAGQGLQNWYAVMVIDASGSKMFAISNPVWFGTSLT